MRYRVWVGSSNHQLHKYQQAPITCPNAARPITQTRKIPKGNMRVRCRVAGEFARRGWRKYETPSGAATCQAKQPLPNGMEPVISVRLTKGLVLQGAVLRW